VKISAIRAFPVSVGIRHFFLVKIETDGGYYGWGESGFVSREFASLGTLADWEHILLGRDPLDRGAIWEELFRLGSGSRAGGAVLAAIDIALFDIAGKRFDVPVYQLLGGRQRETVRLLGSCLARTQEEVVAQAHALVDDGWDAIRLFILGGDEGAGVFEPRASLAPTAAAAKAVRDAVGDGPLLGLDYHARLDVAEAAAFCQQLDGHVLDFLEEPIRDEAPGAYRALRNLTRVPFAIGEEFLSPWQFLPYLEQGLMEFCRVDVCNAGGITGGLKVAAWCQACGVDLIPHNPLSPICSAASAHLASAIPNFSCLEIRESPTESLNFYDPEIFPMQPSLNSGRLTLLDMPGLGVDVNEAALGDPFTPLPLQVLRQRDGSYTNS